MKTIRSYDFCVLILCVLFLFFQQINTRTGWKKAQNSKACVNSERCNRSLQRKLISKACVSERCSRSLQRKLVVYYLFEEAWAAADAVKHYRERAVERGRSEP